LDVIEELLEKLLMNENEKEDNMTYLFITEILLISIQNSKWQNQQKLGKNLKQHWRNDKRIVSISKPRSR